MNFDWNDSLADGGGGGGMWYGENYPYDDYDYSYFDNPFAQYGDDSYNLYNLPQPNTWNNPSMSPAPGSEYFGDIPIGGASFTSNVYDDPSVGGGGNLNFTPTRGPQIGAPTRTPTSNPIGDDPIPYPDPTQTRAPSSPSQTTSNTYNVSLPSYQQNNPPPISSSLPDYKNPGFEPLSRPPSQRQPSAPSPSASGQYGVPRDSPPVDVGGGKSMPTQKSPSFKDMMFQNALNISGLNRYKKAIKDVRSGKGFGAMSPYF